MDHQIAYFGPGWELLQHVNQVYQSRELVLGILHSDSANMVDAATRVCQKVEKRFKFEDATRDRHITANEEQALQQLLKTMQFPSVTHQGAICKRGQTVVTKILQAVYGKQITPGNTVVDIIAFGPMNKADVFRQACISVLKRCISSANCFTLMSVGFGSGCEDLVEETLLYALTAFPECLQNNLTGFCQLDESCLGRLLSNSHLQITSSQQVLDALLSWVGFAPGPRSALLPSLLEVAVAQEQLDIGAIAHLTSHPLIAGDTACRQVLADAYIRRCLVAGEDAAAALLAH